MDSPFPTPEYLKELLQEIVGSQDIQDALRKAEAENEVKKVGATEVDDNDPEMFKIWFFDQCKRYEFVKEAMESYMKSEGKILPPEKWDFMRWFAKYAKGKGDFLAMKIEDIHFDMYHNKRAKALSMYSVWEGLFNALMKSGYIRTNLFTFGHIMEFKHLPEGGEKVRWLTFKADAMDFTDNFGFSMPQVNRCFLSKDGRPFKYSAKNKNYPYRNPSLSKIIEEYLPIIEE